MNLTSAYVPRFDDAAGRKPDHRVVANVTYPPAAPVVGNREVVVLVALHMLVSPWRSSVCLEGVAMHRAQKQISCRDRSWTPRAAAMVSCRVQARPGAMSRTESMPRSVMDKLLWLGRIGPERPCSGLKSHFTSMQASDVFHDTVHGGREGILVLKAEIRTVQTVGAGRAGQGRSVSTAFPVENHANRDRTEYVDARCSRAAPRRSHHPRRSSRWHAVCGPRHEDGGRTRQKSSRGKQ